MPQQPTGNLPNLPCVQALEAAGHDVDAALLSYNKQRHKEVLALHELDLVQRKRLGAEGALAPIALANSFHAVSSTLLSAYLGTSCCVSGAAQAYGR